MKKPTYKELEKRKKEAVTLGRIATALFIIFFLVSLVNFLIIDELKNQLAECRGNQTSHPQLNLYYDCPVFIEEGTYSLNSSGILISPSGKQINCEEVKNGK